MLPSKIQTALRNYYLREVGPSHWQCKCPGHRGEGRSSLSIKVEGKKVLVHCFAGCSTEYVLDSVGLNMMDLFIGDEHESQGHGLTGRVSCSPVDFNAVYSSLLSTLYLIEDDAKKIKARGIQNPIELGYRSTLNLTNARQCVEEVYGKETVEQVPGFKVSKYPVGFFIPIRTPRGDIRGLLLRTTNDARKYLWFSGNGVSLGQVWHCPLGVPPRCDTVRVTEGPLKADVCWALDKSIPTIAVGGVSSWPAALTGLRELGAKTVHVAFDADYKTNAAVGKSLRSFLTALKEDGYNVVVETWDATHKGIDDLLGSGGRPQVLSITQEFMDSLAKTTEETDKNKSDVVVCLADVKPRKVEWLWKDWLPIGNVTIMDGDPGLGKSQITCALAAAVTSTGVYPEENLKTSTDVNSNKAGVVFMTAEDSAEDTIVPRLMAAGADLTKCHQFKYVRRKGVRDLPALPEDIDRLSDIVCRTKSRLLVIDPLFSYIGAKTDTHKDQEIRKVMQALFQLAEKQKIAVLVLRHLNKGGTSNANAIYRGSGSIGVVASTRVGWIVGHGNETDTYVLAQTKNNLAPMPTSLMYRIVEAELDGGIRTSSIHWSGTTELRANDITQSRRSTGTSETGGVDWLADIITLAGGSLDCRGVKEAADRAGVSYTRLLRISSAELAGYGIVKGVDNIWRIAGAKQAEAEG